MIEFKTSLAAHIIMNCDNKSFVELFRKSEIDAKQRLPFYIKDEPEENHKAIENRLSTALLTLELFCFDMDNEFAEAYELTQDLLISALTYENKRLDIEIKKFKDFEALPIYKKVWLGVKNEPSFWAIIMYLIGYPILLFGSMHFGLLLMILSITIMMGETASRLRFKGAIIMFIINIVSCGMLGILLSL